MSNKLVLGFLGLIVLASVLMAMPALFRGSPAREAATAPTTAGAGGATASANAINWRHDFDAAVSEAAQAGMPLLVDFTADWCPPCKEMAREVFPQADVIAAVTAGFVPVKVDLTNPGKAERKVADKYNVQAIPTLIVLTADGRVVKTQVGGLDRGQMLSWLKSAKP